MAYISTNYTSNVAAPIGKWTCAPGSALGPYADLPPTDTYGDPNYCGQCVSYVKKVCPTLPRTTSWQKGAAAKGNQEIKPGTVIATFTNAGAYAGHAAIYVSQSTAGLDVYDQYVYGQSPKGVGPRTLRFGAANDVNNGDKYYVVE